jgi:hypothetical protein
MKEWPDDDELVDFPSLVGPLRKALSHCYKLVRKNTGADCMYEGYNIGKNEQTICLTPDQELTAKSLEYNNNSQGRDAATTILSIAVRLGIEQGRRMVSSTPHDRLLKRLLEKLEKSEGENRDA